MKFIVYTSILICFVSCNQPVEQTEAPVVEEQSFDSTEAHDLTVRNQRLRYNNDYYNLNVEPYVDSASRRFTVRITLHDERDTVFSKLVNADTLISKLKTHPNFDSIDLSVSDQYKLKSIVPTRGIRGYNTYQIAKLAGPKQPDLYIKFAIKAWGDHHSKKERLWIMWFNNSEAEYVQFSN